MGTGFGVLPNTVNVLDATQSYTLKWLKWSLLCLLYHNENNHPLLWAYRERSLSRAQ